MICRVCDQAHAADVTTLCCSCGRSGLPVHPLKALNAGFKGCDRCIKKHGRRELRIAANIMLANGMGAPKKNPSFGKCARCREQVMLDARGTHPLWCANCEKERRSIA